MVKKLVVVGGGGWVLKPILVCSFNQAEQFGGKSMLAIKLIFLFQYALRMLVIVEDM